MKSLLIYAVLFACSIRAFAQQPDTTQLITPFGKPTGKEAEAKIGKEGGKLVSEDGRIELEIPPGAFDKKTTISIQPVANTLSAGGGTSYHLQPSGIKFNQPVKITFHYNENGNNSNDPQWRGIAMQDEQGRWHNLNGIELDSIKKTISGKINHFSYWVDYERVNIAPASAKVKVNKQISLQLIVYTPSEATQTAPGEDALPELPPMSIVRVPLPPVWSANGVVNGNAVTGTIRASGNGLQPVYHAPAAVPARNPVAVTADLKNLQFKIGNTTFNNLKVTSNVLVYDENTFEVKMEAWVDQTSLYCGQRAVDEGGFIVQVQTTSAKVLDIRNSLMTIPIPARCPCNPVWINQPASIGPIHIAGVQSITVTPPAPPSQPDGHVRIFFVPTMAVLPVFFCAKATMPSAPPMPALPRMIDFLTKKEEQVLYNINETMMGLKITVKPVREDN
jgi:hypothetical protein